MTLYERQGVSNHRQLYCLLHHLFRPTSKKTQTFHITALFDGNRPVTGGFPSWRRTIMHKSFPHDHSTTYSFIFSRQFRLTGSARLIWLTVSSTSQPRIHHRYDVNRCYLFWKNMVRWRSLVLKWYSPYWKHTSLLPDTNEFSVCSINSRIFSCEKQCFTGACRRGGCRCTGPWYNLVLYQTDQALRIISNTSVYPNCYCYWVTVQKRSKAAIFWPVGIGSDNGLLPIRRQAII